MRWKILEEEYIWDESRRMEGLGPIIYYLKVECLCYLFGYRLPYLAQDVWTALACPLLMQSSLSGGQRKHHQAPDSWNYCTPPLWQMLPATLILPLVFRNWSHCGWPHFSYSSWVSFVFHLTAIPTRIQFLRNFSHLSFTGSTLLFQYHFPDEFLNKRK